MDTITSLIDTSCRKFEFRPAFLRKCDGEWQETSAVTQGRGSLSDDETISLLRREVYCSCEKLAAYTRVKRVAIRHEEFSKATTRKIKRFELERLMAGSAQFK